MPWKLWRHLGLSTLGPFALLFAGLSGALILLLALRVGELAPAASFGLGELLPIFGYGLPHLSLLTIPVTFLAGVLVAYGQLSADGGYVAARSAGMGPVRLGAPALILGLLCTAFCYALTLWAEPLANKRLNRSLVRLAKVGLVSGLRPRLFNEAFRDVTVYVGRVERGGELRQMLLHDRRNRDRQILAFARQGRLRADRSGNSLFLEMEQGEIQTLSPGQRLFRQLRFGRYRFDLDIGEMIDRRLDFTGTASHLTLAELEAFIAAARRKGYPTWRYDLALHRRFSLPFATLIFAIFGVALGLGRVRAPRVRAALTGVFLVAVYYTLLRTGDGLAARGQAPVLLAAWLPNLVLFPLGIALLWRKAVRVS